MIPLLIATALAGEPEIESVSAVKAVSWAQPFTLSEAESYGMRGDKPSFDAGWILQLEIEAGMGRARAVDTPVLYVGEFPARILNPGETTTCLVVWVPKAAELDQSPIFFGERTLPEQVDADSGRAQRDAALAAGAKGPSPADTTPPLQAASLDAVWTAAQERTHSCR